LQRVSTCFMLLLARETSEGEGEHPKTTQWNRLTADNALAVATLDEEAHRLIDLELELVALPQDHQPDLFFLELLGRLKQVWSRASCRDGPFQ